MPQFYNARTFSRVDAGGEPVTLTFPDGTVIDASMTDLSMSGMRADVVTPISAEPDTVCAIEFFVNAHYQVNITSRLTWNGGTFLGFRFEALDAASFEYLKEFVLSAADDAGEVQLEIDLHSELLPDIV